MRYVFAIFILVAMCSYALPQDQLYLSGYVVSYDKSTGIAVINVATPGCEGIRQFYVRGDPKESIHVGKRIHFHINAAECEAGKIYEMIFKKR